MEKNYNFKVTADTEQQCLEKVTAASEIIKALPHDDLIYLQKRRKIW